MAVNMKTKYDKYLGSFEKINKIVFLAVVPDPRYKLDYLGFCFESVYDDVMAKALVDGIEAYLMRLSKFYKSQVDGFDGGVPKVVFMNKLNQVIVQDYWVRELLLKLTQVVEYYHDTREEEKKEIL